MLEGWPILGYSRGIVTGEVIVGANLFRDLFANIGYRRQTLREL